MYLSNEYYTINEIMPFVSDKQRKHVMAKLNPHTPKTRIKNRYAKSYPGFRLGLSSSIKFNVKPNRIPEPTIFKPQFVPVGKFLIETAFQSMIFTTPFVREVYCAYKVSDALYSSWNLIKHAYDSYQIDGWSGVTTIIGKKITFNYLSTIQTNIAWEIVKNSVSDEYSGIGRNITSKVIDNLTEEEINYVEQFIQQHK